MGLSNNFDSGLSLQLVIKGFGGDGGLDILDMLQEGIFGYRRPYFLSN
jgi:LPS-assembly protein